MSFAYTQKQLLWHGHRFNACKVADEMFKHAALFWLRRAKENIAFLTNEESHLHGATLFRTHLLVLRVNASCASVHHIHCFSIEGHIYHSNHIHFFPFCSLALSSKIRFFFYNRWDISYINDEACFGFVLYEHGVFCFVKAWELLQATTTFRLLPLYSLRLRIVLLLERNRSRFSLQQQPNIP